MTKNKTVVTKKPSNSSTAGSIDNKPKKPKKPKATQIGYSSLNPKGVKRMNKSAKQSMRRPGLVTSKASGG